MAIIADVTAGNFSKTSDYNNLIDVLDANIITVEVTGNVTVADGFFDRKYRIQGAHTITLPTAADNEGIQIWAQNEGDHAAVIDGEGAETLTFMDGSTAATVTFAKETDWIHLLCDGTTWLVMGGKWKYTTATLTHGSGTADGGGAYTDSAVTYRYWIREGITHFAAWGWVEVDNTSGNVFMNITMPITFSRVDIITTGQNGRTTAGEGDPSSLIDADISPSGTTNCNACFEGGASTLVVNFNSPGGNFTNGDRWCFSIYILGVV